LGVCELSCWVCVKFLLLGVCGFVLLGGGGVSRIFGILCFCCCCGTYFYTQALKGGRVLLKKWVWVGVEMAIETKVFQFSEVQTHGSPTDCWLIIHGKVYDVTKFLEHHPGGDDVLLSATGIEFLGLTYFSNNPFEDFI
jgi:hypothetical protein